MKTLSRVETKKAQKNSQRKKLVVSAVVGTVGVASLATVLATSSPQDKAEAKTVPVNAMMGTSEMISSAPIQAKNNIQPVAPVTQNEPAPANATNTGEEKLNVVAVSTPANKAVVATPVKQATPVPVKENQGKSMSTPHTVTSVNHVVAPKPVVAVNKKAATTKPIPTKQTPTKQTLKEMLGKVIRITNNSLVMDVEGEQISFKANDQKVLNEMKSIAGDDAVVVRYTIDSKGNKIAVDLFCVYDNLQGQRGQYIDCDYFAMEDSHTIEVYVNNRPQSFQLSPAFIGEDLDKKFAPGTKVCLAVVKTTAGLIVENIEEQ